MPRDGSGIYSQPFPDVAPDTTIESAVYNGFVADIVNDLNAPRPIVAGGTGTNAPEEALFNFGGEEGGQLVANYDSHIFMPGSFYSTALATGEPVDGHAFAGIAYLNEEYEYPPTNENLVLEVRDLDDDGRKYFRIKSGGVWGAWVTELDETEDAIAALDAAKVAKAGDTMTGPLILSGAPTVDLNPATKKYVDDADALKANTTTVNAALALKADLASPVFTGNPQSTTTPSTSDSDNTVANTQFTQAAINAKAVRYDTAAQGLTLAQQLAARDNLSLDLTLISIVTVTATAAAHALLTGCRWLMIEGQAAGGAGGNVDSANPGAAAAAGGAGGTFGVTELIDVSAVSTVNITIGAAGAVSGAAAGDGGNAADTTVVVGATTYRWGGGNGGNGHAATTNIRVRTDRGVAASSNIFGGAQRGVHGFAFPGQLSVGGHGGSSPRGTGGTGGNVTAAGNAANGASGTGFGAGGGGAASLDTTTDATGAAGQPAMVRLWQFG